MMTLSEAKAIYRTGKGHFFDRETFKYWGSRIESALYKNRCFVTSENNFDGSRRAYTVRRFSPDFLHVETVGEFQEHATNGAQEKQQRRLYRVMKEFMYVFQISKLITFEVNFYTLGTNSAPYFSTSANEFCRSKLDYTRGGQAQRDLLPKFSPARRFFEKWDHCHLHDLTPAEYEEIAADIEELKTRYNYIEDIRDTFRGSRSSIPFYDIVKLSKMEPKKKGGA